MALLDTALSVGLNADYVLFDSWFSNPVQITAIHSKGMDVIAMIKKSSRIKYSYGGEQLNIKEIYSKNKKRHGRSKYLLSVDVMVGKENSNSGENRMRKEQSEPQGLACFYLYGYDSF